MRPSLRTADRQAVVLAGAVLLAAGIAAAVTPTWICPRGWTVYSGSNYGFCGMAWEDDWGYLVAASTPVRIAFLLAGAAAACALLLEATGRVRLAAVTLLIVIAAAVWPLTSWELAREDTRDAYLVAQIIPTLRCPDPGCGNRSIEDVLTSTDEAYTRYPLSVEAFDLVRRRVGLGGTYGRIRAYFVNRFGPSAVL